MPRVLRAMIILNLIGKWRRAMELEKQRRDSSWMEEDQEVVSRNCKVFSCL